jgi:hypothetical protein
VGSLNELAAPEALKAGWNWLLFHNDGSHGVHNPFFASDTLIASRDALLEAAGRLDREGIRQQPRKQQLPATRPGANRWTSWSSRSR